jgi:hypothetical protein
MILTTALCTILYRTGTEILAGGNRPNTGTQSGTSWLVEHLHDGFSKCWQNPLSNGEFDSAICDTGVSRWTNFYIAGLNISTAAPPFVSGVYYDGINFPRETMLRIRRVLSTNIGNEALIDLHQSNTSIGPALSYMMFMPYIDSLWFGESFHYNSPADQFLVEISGLPFGLFGDMLGSESHGHAAVGSHGPNLFRGMVYGMSDRYPNTNISTPVWQLWDSFGTYLEIDTGFVLRISFDRLVLGFRDYLPSCTIRLCKHAKHHLRKRARCCCAPQISARRL